MQIRRDFPRRVRLVRDAFIDLSDGVRLAAQIWLPEDAESDPVPAILEYLPYRKRDGTAERDALTHPYYAGHGYACVRVDMRGAGDSDGVLLGEYLKQEQDDALEVIEWIVAQPWCTGRVGMIGISWGGFNGLQVAARQPEALKAVVSICSTDDRYADDIHFMGGCVLVDKVSWGTTMLAINSTPPDPALVGEDWRRIWLQRLEGSGLWPLEWHHRQRRDEFYRHGSICEDYAAVKTPVYMVGGWADGYTNAVFRCLEKLSCPRKGLVGPWAHKYPHFARPGPQIGFLQETLRWWDHWLKDIDTGIMDEPMLTAWINDPVEPSPYYETRPGRWVAEDSWSAPRVASKTLSLAPGALVDGAQGESTTLPICSPQTVGLAAGKWCAYGLVPDQPGDQRQEAGGSLVFDSPVLEEDVDLLGFPELELEVASDRPDALVAVTLSELLSDGAVTRVSFGILNLTHRNGHETPEPLEPGKAYTVRIRLNACGHRFAAGHRIRLALSTSYWPIVWPSPQPVTLRVSTGASRLLLPVRPSRPGDAAIAFPPPEHAEPLRKTQLEPGEESAAIVHDFGTGVTMVERVTDDGLVRHDDIDWCTGSRAERRYSIRADDPLSARVELQWQQRYERAAFRIQTEACVTMHVTQSHFVIDATLDAWEGERRVFSRNWSEEIPRDHV